MNFKFTVILLSVGAVAAMSVPVADAGSIFLTGHDPDFHATLGGNATGAQNINKAAINFVTDPVFNPYATGGSKKFLFVQSTSIAVPSGHVNGSLGIIASGYALGTDFEIHGATSGLATELGLLGTKYDAVVVASDFGGLLTQAELNILNSNSAGIISFLNSGGGLYAMAESDLGAGLTPSGGFFGFLPFIVTTTSLNQSEVGFTVTPFGTSLGLTNTDVNGNASHNVFTSTGGMNVVDRDSNNDIMSLAVRAQITTGGVVPIPAAFWAGSSVLALLAGARSIKGIRTRK